MVQAQSLEMVVGGAEANVAAALASLGHEARMVTLLPDTPLGDKARAELGAAGVDTRFVARGPGRMGLYFMEPGAGLRPSSITYDRAGSAFAEVDAQAFDFAGALAGASLLHMSGITPALGPNGVAVARAAVAAAQSAGVPVCFDGNYRAQLWESWDSKPREVLTHRDLLRLNFGVFVLHLIQVSLFVVVLRHCVLGLCSPLLGRPVNTGRVCVVELRWQPLQHTEEVCGFNSHAFLVRALGTSWWRGAWRVR